MALVGFCISDTLVNVFDRHIDDSVKAMEMEQRAGATGHASK